MTESWNAGIITTIITPDAINDSARQNLEKHMNRALNIRRNAAIEKHAKYPPKRNETHQERE
jgi:hypothetical protein